MASTLGALSTGVVITDNLLADNDRYGLLVFGEARRPRCGTIPCATMAAMASSSAPKRSATIADNLSEGNLVLGMVVLDNAAATITNNTVRQNGGNGFLITQGATAELTGNTVTDNGGTGFTSATGSTATLTGNTSSNNGFYRGPRRERSEHRRPDGECHRK